MAKLSLIKLKLNECYYKMSKVGLSFTMDLLKTKTFELAEQESKIFFINSKIYLEFPTSFFTDQWFDEMAQNFFIGVNKGFLEKASDLLNESNFENSNDYLLNVITATIRQEDNNGNFSY